MSKESTLWLNFLDVLERFVDPQVRRVFAKTQTVEHQNIQISQRVQCLRRYFAEIRQVCEIVEAISHHGQSTVNHLERCYLQLAADAKTPTWRHDVGNN